MPTTLDVDKDFEKLRFKPKNKCKKQWLSILQLWSCVFCRQEELERKNGVTSSQIIEKILMYRQSKHEARDFMQSGLVSMNNFSYTWE